MNSRQESPNHQTDCFPNFQHSTFNFQLRSRIILINKKHPSPNHQTTKPPNHQTTKLTAFPTFNIQLSTFNSEAESFLLIRNTHYQITKSPNHQTDCFPNFQHSTFNFQLRSRIILINKKHP
jgi:hypothetical protein